MLDKLGSSPRIVLVAAVLAIVFYVAFNKLDPLDASPQGNATVLIPFFCIVALLVSLLGNWAWDALTRRRTDSAAAGGVTKQQEKS